MTVIRSRQNALLKRVGAVAAGRERDALLLEGERLVRDARAAGIGFEVLLVEEGRAALLEEHAGDPALRVVEDGLLDRVSSLGTSPGVLALASPPRPLALGDLLAAPRDLVLVVAGVSDPGNLGALARAAEAAGATALVSLAGGVHPGHPRALRGSMGSLLRLPVCSGPGADEVAAHLARVGYRQVTAATRGGVTPARFDWSGPLALWVTAETGAAPAVCASFEGVTIPMAGRVESLNVTVAAALLLFAAGRNEGGAA